MDRQGHPLHPRLLPPQHQVQDMAATEVATAPATTLLEPTAFPSPALVEPLLHGHQHPMAMAATVPEAAPAMPMGQVMATAMAMAAAMVPMLVVFLLAALDHVVSPPVALGDVGFLPVVSEAHKLLHPSGDQAIQMSRNFGDL